MADGTLEFDTLLDADNFDKGIITIESAIKGVEKAIKELSGYMREVFNGLDTSSATAQIDKEISAINEETKASYDNVNARNKMGEAAQNSASIASEATANVSSRMMSLNEQLRKAEVELENAKIKLQDFASQQIPTEEYAAAEKEAGRLEQKLLSLLNKKERFEDTGGNTSSRTYKQMQYDIATVEKKLESAEAEMCRLNETGKAFKFNSSGTEFDKLSNNVTTAQNKVDILKQKMSELSAKESGAASSGNSMFEKMSNATQKLSSKMFSAAKSSAAFGGSMAKNINPVPSMISGVSKKIDTLGKKLTGMIKRVFVFSMMTKALRALRSAMQNLISSDKDMSNSLAQIKGNLLTAFAPLYDFVLPAIKATFSALVTFTNYLANVMSSIFGKTIAQSEALAKSINKNSQATDKNTKSAKKNAKEKENQLSGLDEMNRWESDKDSKDSDTEIAPVFNAESMNIGWVDKMKEMMSADNWEGIGELIANKLNSALKKVPWGDIQATAQSIASKLARLMNGFFSVMDLAATLGNTVAQMLNTGLIYAYTFLTTFDFKQFGTFIGTSITSFVKNFKWDLLGKTLGKVVQGAIDTARGFINTYPWGSFASGLATSINNLFASINWWEAGQVVGDAIRGIFEEISTFLDEVNWEQVGLDIGIFLSSMDWDSIISDLFSVIGDAMSAAWDLLLGTLGGLIADGLSPAETGFLALGTAVAGVKLGKFIDKVSETLSSLSPLKDGLSKLATEGFKAAKDAASKMKDALSTAKTTIGDVVTKAGELATKLKDSAIQIASNTGAWIKNNAQTAIAVIKTGLQTAATALQTAAQTALNVVMSMNPIALVIAAIVALIAIFVLLWNNCDGFREFWINLWDEIKEVAGSVWEAIKEFFISAWDKIKEVWAGVKEFFGGVWTGIKEVFSSVKTWLTEKFTNAWNGIKNVFKKVKEFFSGVWDGITSVFGDVADWFKDKFSKAWEAVKNVFSKGGKVFSGIKDGIASAFKTVVNTLIKGINKVIAFPFNKINDMLNDIRQVELFGFAPFGDLWGHNPLPVPQIPKLATGAVIPPRSEFMAILGDQRQGTNIETPEGLLRQIMREELGKLNTSGGGTYEFTAKINRRVLFDEIIKEAKIRKTTTGKNAFQF